MDIWLWLGYGACVLVGAFLGVCYVAYWYDSWNTEKEKQEDEE